MSTLMKAYGPCRKIVDRTNRKSARQSSRAIVSGDVLDTLIHPEDLVEQDF